MSIQTISAQADALAAAKAAYETELEKLKQEIATSNEQGVSLSACSRAARVTRVTADRWMRELKER